MKKILEKLKMTKELILIIVAIIGFIISAYKMYESSTLKLEMINKTTLRTLIWADGIPHRDKIEACDEYLGYGYNKSNKNNSSICSWCISWFNIIY